MIDTINGADKLVARKFGIRKNLVVSMKIIYIICSQKDSFADKQIYKQLLQVSRKFAV